MDRNTRMYEPYLWENEKQSYLRHAVLFGFFVQLNRMYTDTVQKLPTNSESNIMRCSSVPRFKYLPISAPALSTRGTTAKTSIPTSSDDISSRSTCKAYTNGELSRSIDLDDNSSFGIAVPILKSFMQSIHVAEKITQKVEGQLSKSQKECLLRQQRWILTGLQVLEFDEAQHPKERADGWLKVELGSFSVMGKNMGS